MQKYPHHYVVAATASAQGDVTLESRQLTALATAPPAEFDGPGDRWSPETLLVGAIADCFVLTFRAVARATKLDWRSLRCEVEGTLDRVERRAEFTAFVVRATLELPAGADEAAARQALERAEHGCLVTNSLKGSVRLEAMVQASG